jgi:uncharacterized protein (DUF2344 family)
VSKKKQNEEATKETSFQSNFETELQPGVRHLLVNAVSPLRIAILHALATDTKIPDFELLWEKAKERIALSPVKLETWITESHKVLDEIVAQTTTGSNGKNRLNLEIFLAELSRIENYALSQTPQMLIGRI